MKKTLLASIFAAWVWTWVLAQEWNEPKILELPTDCSAVLNQEISWKTYDIITCIWRGFPEDVRALWNFQRTTVWNTINEIWGMLEGILWWELVNDFDIPLTMDDDIGKIWKNNKWFYLLTQWILWLIDSNGYNCHASVSSMDGWRDITCEQGVDTSLLWDDFTCKEVDDTSFITYDTFYWRQSNTSEFNGTICWSAPLWEAL